MVIHLQEMFSGQIKYWYFTDTEYVKYLYCNVSATQYPIGIVNYGLAAQSY